MSARGPRDARPRRFQTLLLAAVLGWVVASDAVAQDEFSSQFGVTQWSTADGLPSQFIPALTQTSDGFLWMESGGALVRFDGISFLETIPSGEGAVLGYLTGSGRGRGDTVWVVDRLGRVAFYHEGRFSIVDSLDVGLHSVSQGGDGRLWVASDKEVWVRGPGGFESARENAPPDVPVGRGRLMWVDKMGRGWTISGPGLVARRVDETGEAPLVPIAVASLLPGRDGEGLMVTRIDGERLLVSDEEGALTFSIPLEDRVPRLVDRAGRLWVSVPGGLEIYPGGVGAPVHVGLGDPTILVHDVLEDQSGSFWAGTHQHGLFRIQAQPVQVYLAGAEGGSLQIRSVARGRDGSVLAVDALGGVTRLGRGKPEVVRPSGSSISAAYEDSRGTLWLGTNGVESGVLLGVQTDGSVLRVPTEIPTWMIGEDPGVPGVIWFTDSSGLKRVSPYTGGTVEEFYSPGWGANSFAIAPDGDVWLSGLFGVVHVADDGVHEYLASAGYPLAQARGIYLDDSGDVWVGTYRSGLVRIREGTVRSVRAADGLIDDVVSSVIPDGLGNLWMASNEGVHSAALSELNAFLDGEIDAVSGVGYGQSSGFVNPENSGRGGYRDPTGRLWFSTFDGVATIDPAAVAGLAVGSPRVVLEELKVNGELVSLMAPIVLSSGHRHLDIRYTGIFLRDPQSLRYQVWMNGSESGWRDVGRVREVTYASLGPGTYEFRVRAINGAGTVSENVATVAFRIPPYFTETLWFPVLGVMALALVVVGSWRTRVRVLKAREATLTRVVNERTGELAEEQARTQAQAEKIEILHQARSSFFSNLSHELRTPLTLILGPLKDLLSERSSPLAPHAQDQLETVLKSGKRLNKLVDQLMETARLESGIIQLNPRTVDIGPFLARLASAFDALAESRSLTFTMSLPPEPIPVALDTEQADAIFSNLIGNAFKYTPVGGSVSVTLEMRSTPGDGVCVIEIADNGPGIPREHAELIFERFHQVEGQVRAGIGTGLGLALTRDLVELHGGTIAVESEVGVGARFTVLFPVAPADAALQPLDGVPPSPVTDEATSESDLEARAGGAVGDGGAGPDAHRSGGDVTTVLLVEDNLELRAWMRSHLIGEYRVLEAADGVSALSEARLCTPDVVIADVMMPLMHGDELCRQIKADPELSFIPVILVTARGSRESLIGGLLGGADDYIVKPFDMEELLLRVRNLVATRRRLRERYESQGLQLPMLSVPPIPVDDKSGGSGFIADLHRIVLEYMADEDLDVERLAGALSMSRATLYRRAEALDGLSPMDFVWAVRLDHAALWLVETEASVAEIAYGVGFKSVPHFSRKFRERFEETPSGHRKSGKRG